MRTRALPRLQRALAIAMTVGLPALVVGCDRARPPLPQTGQPAASQASKPTITGVIPTPTDAPAAADRPEAPAVGAVEAGQARGAGKVGGAPQPTGGAEGPASAPPRSASSP